MHYNVLLLIVSEFELVYLGSEVEKKVTLFCTIFILVLLTHMFHEHMELSALYFSTQLHVHIGLKDMISSPLSIVAPTWIYPNNIYTICSFGSGLVISYVLLCVASFVSAKGAIIYKPSLNDF